MRVHLLSRPNASRSTWKPRSTPLPVVLIVDDNGNYNRVPTFSSTFVYLFWGGLSLTVPDPLPNGCRKRLLTVILFFASVPTFSDPVSQFFCFFTVPDPCPWLFFENASGFGGILVRVPRAAARCVPRVRVLVAGVGV